MAKLRLDTLRMDRQAQAKGEAALYEVRNTDPDEAQGFKRRHGSKIAADGATINAPGVTGRGDNSYFHLDADVGTDSFTIAMAVKAGTIGDASGNVDSIGGGKGYHILATLRPVAEFDRDIDTGLPYSSWVVYTVRAGTTYEVGLARTTAAGAINTDQKAETSGLALAAGDSFRVAAHKDGGTAIKISVRKSAAGSDTDGTDTGDIEDGNAAAHRLEILGAANLTRKHSGDEPVIQQLVYYDGTDHIGQTTATLLPADRSVHGTPDYVFYLNGDDSASESAIINSKSASDDELLHFHPAPPAALSLTGGTTDMALRFGGDSGSFEVPFSSEFLSLFETRVRNVIKSDWTLYIQTTPSATFKAVSSIDRTLVEFGQLARIYYDSSADELLVDINASGEEDPTTIGEDGDLDLAAGTEYDIALQRHSSGDGSAAGNNTFLFTTKTASPFTVEMAKGKSTQDTFLDLRRLYSVILGAQENQKTGTHWAGAVTKFALYPFHVTGDAGKDGAIFYYDFSEGSYEDQANALSYHRSHHSRSVQTPAFSQGSSIYTDGKAIGVGGGLVFADSGPVGYTNLLVKPLATDLHTQQAGRYVFFSSGDKTHVADTRNKTSRPLGLPKPGSNVPAIPAGAGKLDGIYSYGYRFVSKEGTAGPIRRLNPVHTFEVGGSSVIVGQPEEGDGGSGFTLERELGASHGMTETAGSNPDFTTAEPSFWQFWDPGEDTGDMEIFRSPDGEGATASTSDHRTLGVDIRAAANMTNESPECVFNRGITDELEFDEHLRWALIDKSASWGPHMTEEWMGQLCFRYKNYQGDHAAANSAEGQVLFSIGTPDTQGQDSIWWGTDFFASIIVDDTSGILGGGQPRLIISRKTSWNARSWANNQKYSSAPNWSEGYVGGIIQDSDESNAFNSDATFWIDNHDYMVFVGRKGDDLHIWAMDCTGLDFTIGDPISPNLDKCFWGVHTGWWEGMPGADTGSSNGDRGLLIRWGAAAAPGYGDGSGDQSTRNSKKLTTAGEITTYNHPTNTWYHHWWIPGTVFYHGRTWSRFNDPIRCLKSGWRRNAAKDVIVGQTPPRPGPLHQDIHNDIMGGTDDMFGSPTSCYDRARSAPGPAITHEIIHSYPSQNFNGHSALVAKVGIQVRGHELSGGISEDATPLFSLGDYDADYKDNQFRFYMSNLYDGSIIMDNGGTDAYILARDYWRHDSEEQSPNMMLLDGVPAIYQNLGELEAKYDFSEPTWYSFVLDITRIAGETNALVSARNFRINGNPNEQRSEGMFFPLSVSSNILAYASMVDSASNKGFVFIGGHPKVDARDTTRVDELRIWEEDRWDKGLSRWAQGGVYMAQNLMARLETVWAPDGNPETARKNHLLVYAKFQPHDTKENTSLSLAEDTKLAHDGQWAYYDSASNAYTGLRTHHLLHAVTNDEGDYLDEYNGMIIDTGNTGSNPPPGDPPPALPIPAGPKHSVAAVELFRTRGIGGSEFQEEDPGFVARMTEASRGSPLYSLARLPLHDRTFIDSIPDEHLGPEVDESHGTGPPDVVKGVFTWQDQLALISAERSIYFAEPGPFGWESFPYWLTYQVPVEIAGGDVQAGAEIGNGSAIVMGRTWAALLTGSPSSPDAVSLGGGVGAYDAHNLAAHAGAAFAFNGKLWAISPDGSVADIGRPIQGSLPAADQGRLCISSSLASLFLLNTSTGEACRYHFPTQQWTIEDRGALDMGDLAAGNDAWISSQGVYATGDTSRYADFTHTDAPAATTYNCVIPVDGHTSSTVDLDSGTWTAAQITAGTQVTVIQDTAVLGTDVDSDIFASGVVKSVSGASIVLNLGNDTAGVARTLATLGFSAADQVTVAVGGPLLVDSGPISAQDDGVLMETDANIVAGSGWHIGQLAQERIGDRDDAGSVDFVAVASNSNLPVAGGYRGKHHRILARNFSYESAQIAEVEVDIRGDTDV